MKTLQETFTHVVKHLQYQDRQSRDNGKCKYRGAAGRMCAVGCLIPDEMYDPKMENKMCAVLWLEFTVPRELVEYEDMLIELQDLHDSDEYATDGFSGIEDSLKTLASQHFLRMP